MQAALIVFAGGGLGAVIRHLVNQGVTRLLGSEFPWGVMLINISGSFIMGLAAAFFAFKADASWSQPIRLFLTTGVLGGYTTFSAFSLEVVLLWDRAAAGHGLCVGLCCVVGLGFVCRFGIGPRDHMKGCA